MARKKVVKEKVINTLQDLLDDVYNNQHHYNRFLTDVLKRVREEKSKFSQMLSEKKQVLEETPLTRKQFDEEMEKVKQIVNPFSTEAFDTKEEKFQYGVLQFFINKKVSDPEKAKHLISLIWEKLDFMSLLFYFRNTDYLYLDGEDFSPLTTHHIYDLLPQGVYVYPGNLVDKLIDEAFA